MSERERVPLFKLKDPSDICEGVKVGVRGKDKHVTQYIHFLYNGQQTLNLFLAPPEVHPLSNRAVATSYEVVRLVFHH